MLNSRTVTTINTNIKQYTLLTDGNSLLKRSFHGSRNADKESDFGCTWTFTTIMRKICKNYTINKGFVFWDGDMSGKLKWQYYPDYKKSRKQNFVTGVKVQDEDSIAVNMQKIIIQDIFHNLHFNQYTTKEAEADDCISQYILDHPDEDILIVTGDSDLLQLLTDKVSIHYLHNNNLKSGLYNINRFIRVFGYHPHNIPILKSIGGDSADDIAGIKGIGLKGLFDIYGIDFFKKVITLEKLDTKTDFLIAKKIEEKIGSTKKLEKLKELSTNENYLNMKRIITLATPIITENEIKDIKDMKTMDLSNRNSVNILKKFDDLGFNSLISKYYYGKTVTQFLKPFFRLIKHTIKENEQNKNLSILSK